jgi:hypothetical protein
LFILLLPAAFAALVWYVVGQRAPRDGLDVLADTVGVLAVLGASIAGVLMTRYRHTCTYVGALGTASYGLKRSRAAIPTQSLFLFADAAELRTGQTRKFVNGGYVGTTYYFTWTDQAGRTVKKFTGTYRSQEGTPKQKDPYWFPSSAERAWSIFLLDRLDAELRANGYVQFSLGGQKFVRVGRGFFEFSIKGELARITTDEIKTLDINSGYFHIHHKDAKWFSKKGKFDFAYGEMANARLFLLAMEKLTGHRFA